MNILAVIPARMGSSRFPGKPMVPILGKPMIGHVYDRVRKSSLVEKAVVATCDREIADYIQSIGGAAIMTSPQHERASDRCAEALQIIEEREGTNYDIVVMVQGDEPMTRPEMIDQSLRAIIDDPSVQVVNLVAPIPTLEEFEDRNCIKVVVDQQSDAIYFSRQPIPTNRSDAFFPAQKQVCIIPFRRDFLLRYTAMSPTPLEIAESIDMLRVLEHGMKVRMVPTEYATHAVDTEGDLKKVEALMEQAD